LCPLGGGLFYISHNSTQFFDLSAVLKYWGEKLWGLYILKSNVGAVDDPQQSMRLLFVLLKRTFHRAYRFYNLVKTCSSPEIFISIDWLVVRKLLQFVKRFQNRLAKITKPISVFPHFSSKKT
jgi:hypothetical protein